MPSLFVDIEELERKLGLSPGFVDALLKEDDWSFVIKLHALFESVCTHLLVYHFRESSIHDVVSHLELSNKRTGKVAFSKALGLLGDDARRYISSLSELRNKLVHDVRQSTFRLAEMVGAFDAKALKAFTKTFSPHEARTPNKEIDEILRKAKAGVDSGQGKSQRTPLLVEVDSETMASLMARAKTEPKLHMWVGAINVFTSLGGMYGYSDYQQKIRASQILQENESEI